MTEKQIQSRARRYMKLQKQAAEIEKQLEAIRSDLKAEMDELDTSAIRTGGFTIRWFQVISQRFDSRKFKAEHSELYKNYTMPVESMRFTIAGV